MFIGSTGFKFPVCYFPTIEVDPTTLYHQFWNAVYDLAEFGFKVLLAICDGAQANRTFIQCHFDDAGKENFTTTNIYTGEPLVFMVDPSVSSQSSTLGYNHIFKYINNHHHVCWYINYLTTEQGITNSLKMFPLAIQIGIIG